jgi:hypothetical protein
LNVSITKRGSFDCVLATVPNVVKSVIPECRLERRPAGIVGALIVGVGAGVARAVESDRARVEPSPLRRVLDRDVADDVHAVGHPDGPFQ